MGVKVSRIVGKCRGTAGIKGARCPDAKLPPPAAAPAR
jgi:hypothetical protein